MQRFLGMESNNQFLYLAPRQKCEICRCRVLDAFMNLHTVAGFQRCQKILLCIFGGCIHCGKLFACPSGGRLVFF